MVLIAVGTVAQKSMGLYESQRLFFSSFVLWLGYLPLPGGRTISALLLIGLLTKLIVASPWRKANSGIFIAHLGVALLLIGGLVTAASSIEGYVALEKNDTTDHFYDYHKRELTIAKNKIPLVHIPLAELIKEKKISNSAFPFTITINDVCHNCTMAMRDSDAKNLKGHAQKVKLSPLADYLEEERNLSGAEITVTGASADADGIYLAFEPMEKQPEFTIGNDTYTLTLSRENYPLPFSLQLLESEKQVHPGTDVPRSYRSTVLLSDGDLHQRAIITMNHPLRYKGYTVYQASFNGGEDATQTKSVSFAIVQNSGRVFPYVASLTLCLGLIIHLCLRLPTLIKRSSHED